VFLDRLDAFFHHLPKTFQMEPNLIRQSFGGSRPGKINDQSLHARIICHELHKLHQPFGAIRAIRVIGGRFLLYL
jgi:hypothetical protein